MTTCKKCNKENIVSVQYRGTTEDYDGISEYECIDCWYRQGRWSGKELLEGELEKRYGNNNK